MMQSWENNAKRMQPTLKTSNAPSPRKVERGLGVRGLSRRKVRILLWALAILPTLAACQSSRYVSHTGMPVGYTAPGGSTLPASAERATLAGRPKDWIVYSEAHTRPRSSPGGFPQSRALPAYAPYIVLAETDSALQLCPADKVEHMPNGLLKIPGEEAIWAPKAELILWRTAIRQPGSHGPYRVMPALGLEQLAVNARSVKPRLKASIDSSQLAGTVPGGGGLDSDRGPTLYYVIKTKRDSLLLASEPSFTEGTANRRLLGWQPAARFVPFTGQVLRLRLRHEDSLRPHHLAKTDLNLFRLDTLYLDSAGHDWPYVYQFRYPTGKAALQKRSKMGPPLVLPGARPFYLPILPGGEGRLHTLLPLAAHGIVQDTLVPAEFSQTLRPTYALGGGAEAHPGLRMALRNRSIKRLYQVDTGFVFSAEELTQLLAPATGLNYNTERPDRRELAQALFRLYQGGFAPNGEIAKADSLRLGQLFTYLGRPAFPKARSSILDTLRLSAITDTVAFTSAECTLLMRQLSGMVHACEEKRQTLPMPYPGKGTFEFVPKSALRLRE